MPQRQQSDQIRLLERNKGPQQLRNFISQVADIKQVITNLVNPIANSCISTPISKPKQCRLAIANKLRTMKWLLFVCDYFLLIYDIESEKWKIKLFHTSYSFYMGF